MIHVASLPGIILGAFKKHSMMFNAFNVLLEPPKTPKFQQDQVTPDTPSTQNQLQPSTEASYGPVKQVLNAAPEKESEPALWG